MRTRIFNKMTAREIEGYLNHGGDIIFIPLGVTEVHGELPVDCETILAEAYSVVMAEQCDGVVLTNLPYFYPGGTVISNATVHLSIADGMAYLTKICKSLVDQGFKRLILVSGHAPAFLTANAFTRDFFEATQIHPCHLNLMNVTAIAYGGNPIGSLADFDTSICGAYQIMGLKQFLPVDPNAETNVGVRLPNPPEIEDFAGRLRPLGGMVSLVFSDPLQHGGGNVFRSEAERDEACAKGEAYIREAVSRIDVVGLCNALANYQAYVKGVCEKFPRLNKLS